jgi:hypothetical protein
VELLQPISHDFIHYSRGLHEVTQELKAAWLKLKDPITKKPTAREPEPGKSVPTGTTSETHDHPRRRGLRD